ncbi:MAG: sulfate transporter CysZ [Gammaproteobacteria bacterium]
MTNPIKGAQYFIRGLGLLNQSGVRRYVIIPFLLNISIFAVLMYVAAGYFNDLLDWIISFLPEALSWLTWILWPLFFIIGLLIFSFSFSIIANLIAAPFNGFLAFAIEEKLTGTPPPSSGLSLSAEIILSFKNAIRNLLYSIMWAIPIVIVSFIPVINIVIPFLWLIYGAWMMSLQYMDYPMGNYSMSFKNIRANLAEKRILTLGFGGITTAATMIPIVNFLVMPTAVAGATILWVEEYLPQQETFENSSLTNETINKKLK